MENEFRWKYLVRSSGMIADTSVSFTNQQSYTHCGGVRLQQYHSLYEIIANDVLSLLDSCAAEHYCPGHG